MSKFDFEEFCCGKLRSATLIEWKIIEKIKFLFLHHSQDIFRSGINRYDSIKIENINDLNQHVCTCSSHR